MACEGKDKPKEGNKKRKRSKGEGRELLAEGDP